MYVVGGNITTCMKTTKINLDAYKLLVEVQYPAND